MIVSDVSVKPYLGPDWNVYTLFINNYSTPHWSSSYCSL